MKNMGLKNFDNSDKINLHTFAVCAYGESPYLEECVQSLLAQKVRTRILIATSTPNSYIYGIGEKYGIPVHINHGEKGLAGDWNFAYSCATTPLVTLAHQDDRYYVNYTEDVLAAAKKCRHPLIIFTDYNELRNGKTVTTNRLLKVKRLLLTPLKLTVNVAFHVIFKGKTVQIFFYKGDCRATDSRSYRENEKYGIKEF